MTHSSYSNNDLSSRESILSHPSTNLGSYSVTASDQETSLLSVGLPQEKVINTENLLAYSVLSEF